MFFFFPPHTTPLQTPVCKGVYNTLVMTRKNQPKWAWSFQVSICQIVLSIAFGCPFWHQVIPVLWGCKKYASRKNSRGEMSGLSIVAMSIFKNTPCVTTANDV